MYVIFIILLQNYEKKPYMHTIVGSSGRNFVLIILFQLQGSKTGLFESNLFWVG